MMIKNRTLERLMRFLLTLLGTGLGLGAAALAMPFLRSAHPSFIQNIYNVTLMYSGAALLGAALFFLLSRSMIAYTLRLTASVEAKLETMSFQQILLTCTGLITGLVVAALLTQLILSAGASLITISFSALTYLVLGTLGMRVGFVHGRDAKLLRRLRRSRSAVVGPETAEAADAQEPSALSPRKYLDTSVIIDGRILDIVKTGFLEGEIVVPQFVLAELRHIADSGDGLRRARGRRGLDVLQKMQKDVAITVEETDYPDVAEVDVKLLRLCRDNGGTVVTNDYNLNKVAGVTGIRVLNITDLANAVKPMLMAGEELNVQVVREGKEPGQGVAYLDDGTMIVIENGRRHIGQTIPVTVTTVLQTSAGRMIFTKAA